MELAFGSHAWWQHKQSPEWVAEGTDKCRVTFWWRDPNGDESTSPVRRVWLYITGVTDHHQQAVPQSLQRTQGTDAWSWTTSLSSHWRGSYCLIPSLAENDFSEAVMQGDMSDKMALREGWRRLLPQAIADPLNPLSWRGGRGHPVSGLELPDAPEQPGWKNTQVAYTAPQCINWYSEHLHNTRRVWVYTTGEVFDPAERPLAILLDGEFWAQSMPVWPVLQSLTLAGQLPAAVYVLVGAIDTAHRSRELPCNPDFWLAVKNDLLPRIAQLAPFNPDAQHTVVAGQSFGGLASLYAALHWPEHFGCALSLSGSYWWPNRGETVDGELIHQVQSGQLPTGSPRIILEAGLREPLIFRASQAMYTQLQHAQYNVLWRQFDGGHDAFCWRGGLTSGLTTLWAPLLGQ